MWFKVGILLILSSFFPWLILPVAAWLAPTATEKAAWSAGLVTLAELLFWPGLFLAGRDVWTTAKGAGWKKTIPELLKRLRS